MQAPKAVRLEEFYRRLGAAPAAHSLEEANRQVAAILSAVEDALSGAPYNPAAWMDDGRLYPPQEDSSMVLVEHPRVTRLRSRWHYTFLGDNGSLEITRVDGTVEVSKRGADGRGVWDLDQ